MLPLPCRLFAIRSPGGIGALRWPVTGGLIGLRGAWRNLCLADRPDRGVHAPAIGVDPPGLLTIGAASGPGIHLVCSGASAGRDPYVCNRRYMARSSQDRRTRRNLLQG